MWVLEWELNDAAAEVECVRRRRRLSLGGRSGHVLRRSTERRLRLTRRIVEEEEMAYRNSSTQQ